MQECFCKFDGLVSDLHLIFQFCTHMKKSYIHNLQLLRIVTEQFKGTCADRSLFLINCFFFLLMKILSDTVFYYTYCCLKIVQYIPSYILEI